MKRMTCPINGERPIQEFHFGGDVREMPDPAAATDEAWADYVFNRNGGAGVKQQWWRHVPSGVWFVADRDNVTDDILRTYLWSKKPADAGEPREIATASNSGAVAPANDRTTKR